MAGVSSETCWAYLYSNAPVMKSYLHYLQIGYAKEEEKKNQVTYANSNAVKIST